MLEIQESSKSPMNGNAYAMRMVHICAQVRRAVAHIGESSLSMTELFNIYVHK